MGRDGFLLFCGVGVAVLLVARVWLEMVVAVSPLFAPYGSSLWCRGELESRYLWDESASTWLMLCGPSGVMVPPYAGECWRPARYPPSWVFDLRSCPQ